MWKVVFAVLLGWAALWFVERHERPAGPPVPFIPAREPCEGRPQERCAAPCEFRQSCPTCDDLPRCREPGG